MQFSFSDRGVFKLEPTTDADRALFASWPDPLVMARDESGAFVAVLNTRPQRHGGTEGAAEEPAAERDGAAGAATAEQPGAGEGAAGAAGKKGKE
jgi:hypothetical protein